MEDLAATLMSTFSHRHSAPLYLFCNVSTLPKHHRGGGGFEFATAAGGKQQQQQRGGDVRDDDDGDGGAGVRACSSDVSAAMFADELFRDGAALLPPLKLPPRLQTPSASAAASAATSPTATAAKAAATSRSPFASSGRKSSKQHGGFDPFAAALEKVRRDVAAGAAPIRRARSLSPLRVPAAAAVAKGNTAARAVVAARPAWRRRRRGMKRLLCGAAMPHRAGDGDGGGGAPYRRGLLVCFGF
uniref:Uncharacterized protein n=1 Tax=Leersia perrieri TaxID=77586 RepID=A0A0D9UZR9_9ORYZ